MRRDERETRWYSLADRRDRADARKLWEEIFPEDSESFLNYYDQWKASRNRMETRRRSGELISMIQWNPYRIRVGAQTKDSYYVIAVATKPEYRHQGLMAGQLRDGFRKFREEGVPFLFLMPADPAIYQPFDFRYIYDRTVMTVAGENCPERAEFPSGKAPAAEDACGSSCSDLTIRPLTPEEWEEAASFSENRLADHFGVYAERDAEYVERSAWECRSEGGDAEGIFRDGCMVGTFSWWWESDTVVGIREMILLPEFETKAGLAQIREALAARWPEAEQIQAVMAIDADSAETVPADAQETAAAAEKTETGAVGEIYEQEPIIMGRILDLAEFLRDFTCTETVQTLLKVQDRYIPENNGLFVWTMGPQGSVLEAEEGYLPEDLGEGEIRADIADLLPWLTGYRTPEQCEGITMTAEGRKFADLVKPLRGAFFPEIV